MNTNAPAVLDDVERSVIVRPTDPQEWLQLRLPYFNASATAILFDRHQYQSPADYAVDKIAQRAGSVIGDTMSQRRGQFLEDGIAKWWAHETGTEVIETEMLFTAGRVMCTIDRMDILRDRPVEIKTAHGYTDEPPQYWLDQCQATLLCTGREAMNLVWVDATLELHDLEIVADVALHERIVARSDRFMAAVDFGIVPDWVVPELTSSHIAVLHPEPAGAVEIGEEAGEDVMRYTELREQRKKIDAKMTDIKNSVCGLLGDHEVGLWDGVEIVTFRKSGKSRTFRPMI